MWARERGAQSKHQKIKISFIRRIKLHLDTKRALILLLSARERSLHFATYIIIIEERAEVPYSWNESNIVPGAALSDGVWTVKRTFNSRRIWKKMLTFCSTVESGAVDVMESICERKIVLLGPARAHEYHIFNIKKEFLTHFYDTRTYRGLLARPTSINQDRVSAIWAAKAQRDWSPRARDCQEFAGDVEV